MLTIREFCKKKLIPKKIEFAFHAYCKASLSDYFDIRSSDTLAKIMMKLSEEQVNELWIKFVNDLKELLKENE
jgi:hypothetical protein